MPELSLFHRTLSGVAYGGYAVAAMAYIVEIIDDVVRGSLVVLGVAIVSIGLSDSAFRLLPMSKQNDNNILIHFFFFY